MIMPARCIQPALGRPFLAPFGDDAGGVRPVAKRDCQHLLRRRHFEIYRQGGAPHDDAQILIADMPPILAEVDGDPVATRRLDNRRRPRRIRMVTATRIANGGGGSLVCLSADGRAQHVE
jgi:hypothetical protein